MITTTGVEHGELVAALLAGASGYVRKDVGRDALQRTLRAVLRGKTALPRTMLRRLVDDEIRDDDPACVVN